MVRWPSGYGKRRSALSPRCNCAHHHFAHTVYHNVSPPIAERRERVFLLLAGTFIGAMAMLNIIGITRFVSLGPLSLAVGVLPYPLTFLCTDLISELYGRKRANWVVWTGLWINLFMIGMMWLGQAVPAVASGEQAPWQVLHLSQQVHLPNGGSVSGSGELFTLIYACTAGAVVASMVAYMAAQFCDVYLFHYWKQRTRGKHLWLRNNGSTLISQLVDSVAVVGLTFGAAFVRGDMAGATIGKLLLSNYAFKMVTALLDTGPFYLCVGYLSRYLDIDIHAEFAAAEGSEKE